MTSYQNKIEASLKINTGHSDVIMNLEKIHVLLKGLEKVSSNIYLFSHLNFVGKYSYCMKVSCGPLPNLETSYYANMLNAEFLKKSNASKSKLLAFIYASIMRPNPVFVYMGKS